MAFPTVTIIIPTFRDWERLSNCIEALSSQTYPKNCFDVIIVNNDPNDGVPLDYYLPPKFKVINEVKTGSYAARNAALSIATGEIMGFTDSDCIPDENWINNAVKYFNINKHCSRIAGNIIVFPKSTKATLSENYDKLYAFRQSRYVNDLGACVTANLFAYRSVFEKVGFFNEGFLSFGDLDWGMRAHKAGFKIDYVEDVIVKHPARELNELIKKTKRLAGGKEKLNNKKYGKVEVFLKFFKEARPRVRGYYSFINKNGQHLSSIEKLSILMLRVVLNYLRAYELMRLRLGKKPNRA